jgi:hypothetical protein
VAVLIEQGDIRPVEVTACRDEKWAESAAFQVIAKRQEHFPQLPERAALAVMLNPSAH